jgi:hypothetical protein
MEIIASLVKSLNLTAIDEKEWIALTAIGAFILPLVTLGGFWLVIKQLRSEREALETQTREQVYQASLGILKMFVEHPDLRPYFYDSIPMPVQNLEKSKVLAACEVMGDHWENILLSKKSLDEETLEVWKDYMQGIYSTSPSLKDFLLHEGYRYSGNFLSLFDPDLPDASKRQRTIDLSQRQRAS